MAAASAADGPPIELLAFYKDLCDVLDADPMNLAAAADALEAKGWAGGQSKLSTRLGKLEKHVRPDNPPRNWALIERSHSGGPSYVTDPGRAYYRQVIEILRLYDRVKGKQVWRPRLAVGATNAIHSYLFPDAFTYLFRNTDFLRKHGDLDIEFRQGEHWDLVKCLLDGDIEFAVGPEPLARGMCETQELLTLRKVILYPLDDPRFKSLVGDRRLDLRDLAKFPVCVIPADHEPDSPWHALPRPLEGMRITLPTYALARIWVKFGLAAALSHDTHVLLGDEASLGKRDLTDQLGSVTVSFYFRPGGRQDLSEPAKKVVKAIEAVCAHYRVKHQWPAPDWAPSAD